MGASSALESDWAMAYDILIRNGALIDGTGAPARRADLAIRAARSSKWDKGLGLPRIG